MYEQTITGSRQGSLAISLRFAPLSQALRYDAVGVVNTVVCYAIIVGLHTRADVGIVEANLVGYAVGLTISSLGNRSWTFAASDRGAGNVVALLALVTTGLLANIGLTAALTTAGLAYPVSQAAGFALYNAILFMGLRNVVFALHS